MKRKDAQLLMPQALRHGGSGKARLLPLATPLPPVPARAAVTCVVVVPVIWI